MEKKEEELKKLLPRLSISEIRHVLEHLNSVNIDQIDFYSAGFDCTFDILQSFLFQNYNIKIPSIEDKNPHLNGAERTKIQENIWLPNIKKLFLKPKIIGLIGDIGTGKSNLIYDLIQQLSREYDFKIYTFGLKRKIAKNEIKISSINEIEQAKDGIIIVDEFFSLFDFEQRKKKRQIENTLRLIQHNNNILLLAGTPDNFKRWTSAKINVFFFKKCTISAFINGSTIKNLVLDYKQEELGSAILNVETDDFLLYDGEHWSKHKTNYLPEYDTKKNNVPICVPKSVPNIVS